MKSQVLGEEEGRERERERGEHKALILDLLMYWNSYGIQHLANKQQTIALPGLRLGT